MQFRPRLTVQLGLVDFLTTGYCLLSPSSNLTYLASCLFDTNSCPVKFFHAIFCTSSGHFCFHKNIPECNVRKLYIPYCMTDLAGTGLYVQLDSGALNFLFFQIHFSPDAVPLRTNEINLRDYCYVGFSINFFLRSDSSQSWLS